MEQQVMIIVAAVAFLLILSTLMLMMFILRHRSETGKKSPASPQVEELRNIQIACPQCHRPMTTGYSSAVRGIMWRKSSEPPAGFFNLGSGLLKNSMNNGFSAKENRSWQCEPCSFLMIDLSSLIPIKTHKKN